MGLESKFFALCLSRSRQARIVEDFYLEYQSVKLRRRKLIDFMDQLAQQGKDCRGCSGICCTFVGNSMQVSPLEAWDLAQFLMLNRRWNRQLQEKLEGTIQQFRLRQAPPGDGRRTFGRRRYTCPFFQDQTLGCSIQPEAKPYGCLGFNPIGSGVKDGENCRSYKEQLAERELAHQEEAVQNQKLRERYKLTWEKINLPVALLDLSRHHPFGDSEGFTKLLE